MNNNKEKEILVVEDDNDWRDIVIEIFEDNHDFHLTIRANLEEAKKIFEDATSKNNPFDIIICDGSLQSLHDGLKWIKGLHKQGQRVITFSDDNIEGVPQITKRNFDRKELRDLINKLLNKN